MKKYKIGDRCPDCGRHFRKLAQLLPTQEEYEKYGLAPFSYGDTRSHIIVCPNEHEHEPHGDWLEAPHPTPVFEP